MLTNQQELEQLAQVIYEEVQQSFKDQGYQRGRIDLPWSSLPDVIKKAYMRGAAAANTSLINLTVRQGIESEEEKGTVI